MLGREPLRHEYDSEDEYEAACEAFAEAEYDYIERGIEDYYMGKYGRS